MRRRAQITRFTDGRPLRLAPGGSRQPVRGCPPTAGDSRSNVLRVEEEVRAVGRELRSMRMVEEENTRLKRLVADLALDPAHPPRGPEKKSEVDPSPRAGPLDSEALRRQCAAGVSAGHVAALDLASAEPRPRSDAVADPHPGAGYGAPPPRSSIRIDPGKPWQNGTNETPVRPISEAVSSRFGADDPQAHRVPSAESQTSLLVSHPIRASLWPRRTNQ
jgi:hypothetical protein